MGKKVYKDTGKEESDRIYARLLKHFLKNDSFIWMLQFGVCRCLELAATDARFHLC